MIADFLKALAIFIYHFLAVAVPRFCCFGNTRLKIREVDSIFDIIKQRGSTDRKLEKIKGVSEIKTNNKEGKTNFEMEQRSKI